MATNRDDKNKNDLSEAARTMRTSPNPEERSAAASKMGHAGGPIGGAHSHSGSSKREGNKENE